MIATVPSVAVLGMEGYLVDVEVAVAPGLPTFTIVGLPDVSVQEARERVRAAIQASGETWPQQRVTVNLSPAHLRKTGSCFDLAMAIGIMIAGGRIDGARVRGTAILGELSLDGRVRPVRGMLPSVLAAAQAGARAVLVPADNAKEAALVSGPDVLPVDHLMRAVGHLRGDAPVAPFVPSSAGIPDDHPDEDLTDVRGQTLAKRAVEIAAAGGHNLLLIGTPGAGKTLLARRMPGILPPMSEEESFEVTRIYSVAGLLPADRPLVTRRPFRAPHHTGSTTGLIGGGSGMPHPGEVSLAHRGILFMDEFAEFRREVLEALRQPLEDGTVTIVRSRWSVRFPARFQLVAAANPCPCGYRDDDIKPCTCSDTRYNIYRERLSGPILDRIDLQVRIARVSKHELLGEAEGDPSSLVAKRVAEARAVQAERLAGRGLTCNAELPGRDLEDVCRLERRARSHVGSALEKGTLTARGAHRAMRVARTIADLAGRETVTGADMEEALGFRVLPEAT